MRYGWHAQLHIFEYPFYYIEYGIAQLGALQIWRNSKSGVKQAIDAYLNALSLGASKTLPELFKTANAKFDFSAATIKPLMAEVQAELDKQAAMEER
jgi:oligoendopeptidase F